MKTGFPFLAGRRIRMFTITVKEKKCIGCKKCREVCPKGPRIWTYEDRSDGIKAVVKDANFCLYCGMCISTCPTAAITIKIK